MPASITGANKRRVVIVDDSRTMQAVLEQILSLRLGFEVVGLAGDVETAVSMIATLKPDIVTIDLRMPYIDGKVLLEQLAEYPAMRKLVISGHGCGNLGIVTTLEQLGADACIDKLDLSRDPAAFCKKVLTVLAQPKRAPPKRVAAAPAPVAVATGARSGQALPFSQPYPVPLDEQARLRWLEQLHLANDDEDAQLDKLTAHLARTTRFSTCLMTFIDRDTQWIKSAQGLTRGAMARAEAFCNYTLCGDGTLIVPNALADQRFSTKEVVIATPFVRTYVGHPIISATGVRLGAICLLDNRARTVAPEDAVNLRSICDIAASILDARMLVRQAA